MRKILLFVILLCAANLVDAQCPTISGVFINACGTSSEGWNEYVVLKNGNTATLASKITVATPNNATVGYDTKANATILVQSVLDPVITTASCKSTGATPILIPIGATDIIPANATVILFTGGKFEDYPYDFNSYCGSTVYILLSLRSTGPGSGSFSNTAARTTTITTTGCGVTHSYTYTTPPSSGSGGVDGAFAAFTSPDVTTLAAGNSGTGTSGITAVNNGCSVPPPVVIPPPPAAAVTKIIDTSSCHSVVFEGKTYAASTTLDSTFKSVSGHDSVYRTVNITISPITPLTKTIDTSSCHSIIFEGKTYSSSTTLDSTFKSTGGCDSIYRIVNISITPITPLSKTIDTSSCHSIVLESKTYSSSIILDSTFKSVKGCDSIYRTVNITITPITPLSKTIDTSSCHSIVFESKIYSSSTTLDSTFKSIGGCDSIYRTVNITITPITPLNKTIDTSSCHSIVFESKTYSSSTTLDSTFKSIGGCDSIYRTVNITITPITPLNKTFDTSSCHSIVFEGKTYSSSTTLDSTFKSIGGCDSIYRTVNITITPIMPVSKTIDTSSCHSIVFESKTYSSSTTLDSTFKSVGGCDSIYRTVNITISPITPVSKTIDTSSCHSIVFEGKTYSSSIILDSTFKSIGGCDSIYRAVNIMVVSIGALSKTIDTAGCGNMIFEGNTYTSSTILDSTIKTTGGCDSIYRTVNIHIITATNKNININSCSSVTFEGNTYSSSIILDSTFKSVGGCDSIYRTVNITIAPIATSTKIIDTSSCRNIVFEGKTYSSSIILDSTFKSVGGCDSIYRTVNISIVPIVPVTKIVDTTGCNNIVFEGKTYSSSITLDSTFKSVGGCDSIYRTVNIHIITATNKNININSCSSVTFEGKTYTSSIILDSTFKSSGGCDSIYRTVNITIVPIVASTKIIDTSSCSSIVFEGKTYSSSITLDSTFKSTGGCDSIYRTVRITINPITTVTNVIDTSGCGSMVFNNVTYTRSTVLNNTIKSVGGCDSVYNVTNITINQIPEISAGGPTVNILGDGSITLNGKIFNNSSNDFTVVWTPDIAITNTGILNPSVSPVLEQHYVLTVTSGKCSASDGIDVIRTQNILVPTAFSPNGDGINEVWDIKNMEQYASAKVTVFNRYGQYVFESDGDYSRNPWDGTYHGQPLTIGSYFYIIKLSSSAVPISGSVALVR